MRFFAYQGTDNQGRATQGTIQAASADEAKRLLTGGGVRPLSVRELSPATAAPAARPVSTPVAQQVVRPVVRPAAVPQPTALPTLKPRFAGNKTSFLFFDALGRYLRSGVAANRALEELGQSAQKQWLGERLIQASSAVGKGASLADALDACACFPTGSVGTIRAGEASGSVPDACDQAAHGCEQAHRLGSRCAAMTIMFIFIAVFLPIGISFVNGSVSSMEAQADANSSLPAIQTARDKIWQEFKTIAPLAIPWWIVVIGSWRLWLLPTFERARHRAVLTMPILSGRAREESLARASWALTELARAGIPPNRAMYVAADACPNLILADRFREEASKMREQDRLSTAMRGTGLMDPQMVDVVENGELAGDVPGAVASVYRATSAEFERKNATAHTRIWFVLYPILGVLVVLIAGTLYKTLYLGVIHAMLKDT